MTTESWVSSGGYEIYDIRGPTYFYKTRVSGSFFVEICTTSLGKIKQ